MAELLTTHQITLQAGEPHSKIRVRNLQTTAKIGTDAWGRKGKLQPVLISASITLRKRFETVAGEDRLDASTIHYGVLSKAILELVGVVRKREGEGLTLKGFYEFVSKGLCEKSDGGKVPVLDTEVVGSLDLEVLLPKASLIGDGVSLFGTQLFGEKGTVETFSMGMKLHDLRIPTLIGVNPNERLANQIVVANVEVDRWITETDHYAQFEELVVKTIEESSFQTLEALAMHLGHRLVKFFIIAPLAERGSEATNYARFKISLAKPTAVTFADAPVIEVLIDSDPKVSTSVETLWEKRADAKFPPFPLQGRLDAWIRENCKEDV